MKLLLACFFATLEDSKSFTHFAPTVFYLSLIMIPSAINMLSQTAIGKMVQEDAPYRWEVEVPAP